MLSRWLNCNIQSDAKCKRPTLLFIESHGFDPALTNLTEISQLVLETEYDDKGNWDVKSTCRAESSENVNLPSCKATLQTPRMCAVLFMAKLARSLSRYIPSV